LAEPNQGTGTRYVYRRVAPTQWEAGSHAAFVEKPEQGLSLFRAEVQTPIGVVEHAIRAAKEKQQSPDAKVRKLGEKQLARNGESVESWLDAGWHVLRLPESAFTDRGYVFGPTEPDGHVEAFGDHDRYALELLELSEEVPRHEFHG